MLKSAKFYFFNFFNWLFGRKVNNHCEDEIKSTIKDVKDMLAGKNKKFKRMGKLIWDGRMGTYRRRFKIGRNQPCPCGKMRSAPRDVTKPNKFKYCCGA